MATCASVGLRGDVEGISPRPQLVAFLALQGSADSKFKLQRAEGQATDWTSLVAWPVVRLLRPPEGSGKILPSTLDLGVGKRPAKVCLALFPRPPVQFAFVCFPACAIRKPLWQLQAGSREKYSVLGEEH